MIGQIGPLVKGSLRVGYAAALLYTIGVILGAAILGTAIASLGAGVRWALYIGDNVNTPAVLGPVGCLALLGGLRDLQFLRFRLPQPFKQVPRRWMFVFGPYRASFYWGVAVGLAFTTMIQFSLYYVLLAWILLAGQPLLGAAVLGCYGLIQGVILLVEIGSISRGSVDSFGGLLGSERSIAFMRYGGSFLVALGLFLMFRHAGLLTVP